ncbi:MAG: hypothetical protein WCK51_08325 [Armatimonadota bacterium]
MPNLKSMIIVLSSFAAFGFGTYQASSSPDTPTFSKDVAPILYKRCASCHSDSRIAPFSLVGYANVKSRADTIVGVTQSNFMPPWKAKADYGHFRDVAALTKQEKNVLKRWAETGTKEGNPAETPKPPTVVPGWRLGKPDYLLVPGKLTPIPAEGRDFFRDYLIDPQVTKPTWIRAIDFQPKEQGTVHHIIPSLIKKEEAEKLRKIKFDFDDDSWKPESTQSAEVYNVLGFWSTGAPPFESPEGTAFLVNPGDCFILNVHYKPKGKPATEQPQVALYTQESAPKDEMSVNVVASGDIYIQPGEKNARFYAIGPVTQHDTTIYAVWPHMHYLGKTFKAWVKFPGGYSKPLIAIDSWDPDWQLLYYLQEPMQVPKGSKIYVTGTYDNSRDNPRNPHSPPSVVEAGESSRDEMLFFEVFRVEHKPKEKVETKKPPTG